jgi:3-isopropylmalate/(R)-2-methylmalate dehydratase small subunit
LGKNLFDEMRYSTDGTEIKDFVLNKKPWNEAKIIIAGDNFGCGSSREHAPWALLDFGIKCVISTNFADIFYNNCFKNGVLPIKLSKEQIEELFSQTQDTSNEITVSLDAKKLTIASVEYSFEVEDNLLERIIYGLDDVDITLQDKDVIREFEDSRMKSKPWIYAND